MPIESLAIVIVGAVIGAVIFNFGKWHEQDKINRKEERKLKESREARDRQIETQHFLEEGFASFDPKRPPSFTNFPMQLFKMAVLYIIREELQGYKLTKRKAKG